MSASHPTISRSRIPRGRDICPARAHPPAPSEGQPEEEEPTGLRRRLIIAVILATATVTLLLAVPGLKGVAQQVADMNLAWIAVAVAAEIGSCVGYVVIFRLFFDTVPATAARELAWTEEASGALLPTGGVGALAIGGWILRRSGMSSGTIVERSSALFFLTSASNVTALVIGGVMLATGELGGRDTLLLAGGPIVLGVSATVLTLAVPPLMHRTSHRRLPRWVVDLVDGIDTARRALFTPHWRLLGAVGYLAFDVAALGAAFAATGHTVPIDALILGYIIGYLANMLPVPGGFGVLEAGLGGTLIAYGAPATQAVAAVIVYHAIAFWVPSLGGVIAYGRLRRRSAQPVTAEPDVRVGTPA
jgi:uncharacterized membrane protein YbhN (UPF0104 family)